MNTLSPRKSKLPLILSAVVLLGAAGAVLFVLPAETGYDPTGVGAKLGLTEIADPMNDELVRGTARMETQDVLVLSETPLAPIEGVQDVWEWELGPFESVEFKYTVPQGDPVVFNWSGNSQLHYDMHAHPFDGGEDLTESYGIGDATAMTGTYTPAFTGIHGWFWENRSLDTVTVRLEASGGMTTSTIYSGNSVSDRPLEGAQAAPEGSVAGHTMQSDGQSDGQSEPQAEATE